MVSLIQRLSDRAVPEGQGRMQRVANTALPDSFFRDMVDAADRTADTSRSGQDGYIHVSSLIGFCTRRHALLRADGSPLLRSVHGGNRVVWAMGRSAETHVRTQVLSTRRSDALGIWGCPCGREKHRGHFPTKLCPKCERSLSHYGEFTLWDHEAKIVGNPDLVLRQNGVYAVLEIKSMKRDEWKTLTGPKGDHVFQAAFYVDAMRREGFPVYDNVHILYVAKDYVHGSPYKEFVVNTRDAALAAQLQSAREWAMAAHNAVESNVLPTRTLCQQPTSPTAKTCPMVTQCFMRG